VIAASWLGKAKTALQIAAILALIAFDPAPLWVDVLLYVAVAMTLISAADYFFGLRRRIEEHRAEQAAARATGLATKPR
jgi:CDP-diacylglycerol--glycerol-3-phosphate 3-phosphatidyltransferase